MHHGRHVHHKLTVPITANDNILNPCEPIVCKGFLFAKNNLPEEEFNLYQKLFEIINPQIVQPELLIFLHAPVEKLQENIKKRNRDYEQNIPDDYLLLLQQTYSQYIKQHPIRTLFVDASIADFINNSEHFNTIINALEKEYEPGIHYLNLPTT